MTQTVYSAVLHQLNLGENCSTNEYIASETNVFLNRVVILSIDRSEFCRLPFKTKEYIQIVPFVSMTKLKLFSFEYHNDLL